MKYCIVGLGNPGEMYRHTRHNVGFEVLDACAAHLGVSFQLEKYGWKAEALYRGRKVFLLKPSTYMNASGKAVHYWLQQEQIPLEHLLVVYDELNLDVGTAKLRYRTKGSGGGHNGVQSIIDCLKTGAFPRLRVGIGRQFAAGKQTDYVLAPFQPSELPLLRQSIEQATAMGLAFCWKTLAQVMNEYHVPPALQQPPG